jgi:hypothetical protein
MKTRLVKRTANTSPNSRPYSHVVAESNGKLVRLPYSYNLTQDENRNKAYQAMKRIERNHK